MATRGSRRRARQSGARSSKGICGDRPIYAVSCSSSTSGANRPTTIVPTVICVTKVDKLSKQAAAAQLETIARTLQLDPEQIIPFSAVTGEGRDALAEALVALLAVSSEHATDPAAAPPADLD
jgi:GTPase